MVSRYCIHLYTVNEHCFNVCLGLAQVNVCCIPAQGNVRWVVDFTTGPQTRDASHASSLVSVTHVFLRIALRFPDPIREEKEKLEECTEQNMQGSCAGTQRTLHLGSNPGFMVHFFQSQHRAHTFPRHNERCTPCAIDLCLCFTEGYK